MYFYNLRTKFKTSLFSYSKDPQSLRFPSSAYAGSNATPLWDRHRKHYQIFHTNSAKYSLNNTVNNSICFIIIFIFLAVLKDVPNSPLELLKNPEMDSVRMGLFPSLDYKGLYNCLIPLIEVAPLIQNGIHSKFKSQPYSNYILNTFFLDFGEAILQCLGCLLPFLEHDFIDNLPYLTASSIAVLPSSLHQDIVNSLCFYILPFTISKLFLRGTTV